MDLDLRLVRYFAAAAEEQHVGRAAERLMISQPALSRQIHRFEASLGVPLFHRVGRRIELTAAGSVLLEQTAALLAHADHVLEQTRQAANGHAARVRLAYVPGATRIASQILNDLSRHLPQVELQLNRVEWTDQVPCLHDNRADLSLVRLPIDTTGLQYEILLSEPRVAGFARNHPLAKRESISINELANEPIIDTSNQRDYWTVNPRPNGRAPTLGPLANTVEDMIAVVAAGQCMCITAASIGRAHRRSGLRFVPITDIAPTQVAVAWRTQLLTFAAGQVVDSLRERPPLPAERCTPKRGRSQPTARQRTPATPV